MPVVADEADYEGVTGMQLTVIVQTKFFVKFKGMRYTKMLRAIVCEEAVNYILVDLDSLMQWTIILNCVPLPMDPKKRSLKVRNGKEEIPDIPKSLLISKSVKAVSEPTFHSHRCQRSSLKNSMINRPLST